MGIVADSVLQEMERRLRVMLRIQRNIEACLNERQAEQFALAGAVFDQKDGRLRHHYIGGDIAGNVPGSKMKTVMKKIVMSYRVLGEIAYSIHE